MRPTNTRSSAATRCGRISGLFLTPPLALAGAVGHEHGRSAQPAPHLSGPAAVPGQDRTDAPGCSMRRRRRRSPTRPFGCRRARASNQLADAALPTLKPHLIDPFLSEPVIVDEATLQQAPRIVAAGDSRVLITRGDRAYARGATPIAAEAAGGRPQRRLPRVPQCQAAEGPADAAPSSATRRSTWARLSWCATKRSRPDGRQASSDDRGAGDHRHRLGQGRNARRRPPAARAAARSS